MSGPKIEAGPPKTHVGHAPNVKVAEEHKNAGTDPLKTGTVVDPLKPVGDATQKLQGANQLKPKPVAETGPPKDIKNTSKNTSKNTNTTHTSHTTNTKTPEAPTPNINLINPEPKTTLSVEPAEKIVIEALKNAQLANALNPNKNKNELNNLKTRTNDEKTKRKSLKQQQRINTKKEKAKTRKKTFITKKIQTLEGKISKGKKQSRWSISLRGSYAKQLKRLQSIDASNVITAPKVEPTEPTEPKAEPTAEPTAPKAELPTEPTATKAEPTAEPKIASTPEPTADPKVAPTDPAASQVASTAPTAVEKTDPKVAPTDPVASQVASTALNAELKVEDTTAASTTSEINTKKQTKNKKVVLDPSNNKHVINKGFKNLPKNIRSTEDKLLKGLDEYNDYKSVSTTDIFEKEYQNAIKRNPPVNYTEHKQILDNTGSKVIAQYKEQEEKKEKHKAAFINSMKKHENTFTNIVEKANKRKEKRQSQRNQSKINANTAINNIGKLFEETPSKSPNNNTKFNKYIGNRLSTIEKKPNIINKGLSPITSNA